jgi:hypothetical protein
MRVPSVLALLWTLHCAYATLDADALTKKYFGNDAPWYRNRIPFFESSDKDITDVYYYRWKIFRSHQRDLGQNGYISTEFLDDVGWQTTPWASLNDATGFHLLEGRWCRDRRFKEDYATFILGPNSNRRQFSESMAAAVFQGYLVDGVAEDAVARLSDMQTVYNAWNDSFDTSKGLYFVEPIRDATEYTISSIDASGGYDGFFGGDSFRPSINSYQFDNANAIAKLAALKGGMNNTRLVCRKHYGTPLSSTSSTASKSTTRMSLIGILFVVASLWEWFPGPTICQTTQLNMLKHGNTFSTPVSWLESMASVQSNRAMSTICVSTDTWKRTVGSPNANGTGRVSSMNSDSKKI